MVSMRGTIPTVTLGAVVRSGRLEFESPFQEIKLKEGSRGEVLLPAAAVVDTDVRNFLMEDRSVPLLPKGTVLAVQLAGVHEQAGFIPPHRRGGLCSFATILPQGPVLLRFQGTKRPTLEPVRCIVPALKDAEAKSINHACTMLSREFEGNRISNTTNVFTNVFVFKDGARRESLDALRQKGEIAFRQRALPKPGITLLPHSD